ncbi:LANO_0A01398g1_1 [Lachancea nothofagi CBS 11611]|uniref:LANO_0A01398g1_1 n=1 Tax=Lachancea nothofagi CBS 11611 TaxID=1266666 RepID=A0A1G4IMH2_9SACH|nr:LANO_0A01398g1_1 [Lachancea nothofagi CBS 11611]
MTTTVPKVFAFHEFAGVAEAVADHVVHAQNLALSKEPFALKNGGSGGASQGAANTNGSLSVPQLSGQVSRQASARSISGREHSTAASGSSNPNLRAPSSSKLKKIKEKRFKIALSGGSLIQVLHEGLLKRHDVQWGKWDIYFADERLVPFDSSESNFGLTKRKIIDHIDTEMYGSPRIFHINESLIEDPQECADDYEKLLIKGFAGRDSVKLPMFDLLLLGCAPDGHIASLFPNFQENLRENLAWVIPVTQAPSGPSNRISLTIPVICHSHQVTFVVEGATKAPVVKTIMERPEKSLPSSIVNEGAAGRVAWFVDDDALTDVLVTKKKYKFLVNVDEPNPTNAES